MELGDKDRREPGLYVAPIDYERSKKKVLSLVTRDLRPGLVAAG